MSHSKSALVPFVLLACSCASAPAKQASPPETIRQPTVTKVVPAEAPTAPSPAPQQAETRPKLEPGRCVESFDCVDTVGFPPDGQRWACNEGKCNRTKLPDLHAADAPAVTVQAAANEDTTEGKTRKPLRRH